VSDANLKEDLLFPLMEEHTLKNVNNSLNTNIYSYLETSGGQSSNPFLNVAHFLNTITDNKSVAAYDSSFPALVSSTCCSIAKPLVMAI
jgi:hypothetical protein